MVGVCSATVEFATVKEDEEGSSGATLASVPFDCALVAVGKIDADIASAKRKIQPILIAILLGFSRLTFGDHPLMVPNMS